jgi:hypothetical protein
MPTEFRPPGGGPSGSSSRPEGTLLLDQNRPVGARPRARLDRGPRKDLVTLNNFELIARSPYRRRIFQMSALSTVDGRFHAYRGGNG